MVKKLGKTSVAWEEALFKTDSALPSTIITAWSRDTPGAVVNTGHYCIDSKSQHFYLNNKPTVADLWTNIGSSIQNSSAEHLFLGGETSMWTDNYCYISQCFGPGKPVAASLYGPSEDAKFEKSIMGMVWPKATVAAVYEFRSAHPTFGFESDQRCSKTLAHATALLCCLILSRRPKATAGAYGREPRDQWSAIGVLGSWNIACRELRGGLGLTGDTTKLLQGASLGTLLAENYFELN
eukprot:gene2208-2018_t